MPSIPKKTVQLIVENGNDYLMTVKANQPNLLASLELAFAQTPAISIDCQSENSHGREVERVVTVLPAPADIDPQWVGIRRIIKVERKGTRGQKPFHETMFYLTSLVRTASEFAQMIQKHWHVENRLHWPKDVVPREDSAHPPVPGMRLQALRFYEPLRSICFERMAMTPSPKPLICWHMISTLYLLS